MGYLIHHITKPEVQGQVFKFSCLKTTLDALVRSLIDKALLFHGGSIWRMILCVN